MRVGSRRANRWRRTATTAFRAVHRITGCLRSLDLSLNSRDWGLVNGVGTAGLFDSLVKYLIYLCKTHSSSRKRRYIRLIKMTNAINNRPYEVVIRLRNKNTGLITSSALSIQQTTRDKDTYKVFINFIIRVTNMTKIMTTPLLSRRIKYRQSYSR